MPIIEALAAFLALANAAIALSSVKPVLVLEVAGAVVAVINAAIALHDAGLI